MIGNGYVIDKGGTYSLPYRRLKFGEFLVPFESYYFEKLGRFSIANNKCCYFVGLFDNCGHFLLRTQQL
jgi:hypothetical protein